MDKISPQRAKLSRDLHVLQEDHKSQIQLALHGLFHAGYWLSKPEIAIMDGYIQDYENIRQETWEALDAHTIHAIDSAKNALAAKRLEIQEFDKYEFHS